MYVFTNILSQKLTHSSYINLNMHMHNLVLMPYSSTFINAWLIIASILLQMELAMWNKVELLLSCLMQLGGHFQQWTQRNQNFSIKKYPEVLKYTCCHPERWKTTQGEVGNFLSYLKDSHSSGGFPCTPQLVSLTLGWIRFTTWLIP